MVHVWRLLFLCAAVFFIVAAIKLPGSWSPTFWFYLAFAPASVGVAVYGWPPPPPTRH